MNVSPLVTITGVALRFVNPRPSCPSLYCLAARETGAN